MINDDIIIKKFREKGFSDWPERTRNFKSRLSECLKGFPGIGLNDLTLIDGVFDPHEFPVIVDRWLWSPSRETDDAPLMIRATTRSDASWKIEGIGCQTDMNRDPLRQIRWQNTYIWRWFEEWGLFNYNWPWLVVTGKGIKKSGQAGSTYHYFSRCLRDQRP